MAEKCGYCNKEISNFKVKSKVNNSFIDLCSVECEKKFKRYITYRQGGWEFRLYLFFQIIVLIGGVLLVAENCINALIVTIGAIASISFLISNNKRVKVSDIKKAGLKTIVREKNIINLVILLLMILSIFITVSTFNII